VNEYIRGYRPSSRDEVPAVKHPTDYLRPKKGSGHLLEQLHEAAREEGANCLDREAEFTDYETPPTAVQAQIMCYACPVFDLCAKYAEVGHPAWGIYGGKVYGRELAEREEKDNG